jgi:hypothetical protein
MVEEAEVVVPEELDRVNGEVGGKEVFHESAREKESPLFSTHRSFLSNRFSAYLLPVKLPSRIRFQEFCDRASC